MKFDCRMVAIDMDGTLLRRDKTVGERTVLAVNKALEQGVEVIIATGRSRVQAQNYLQLFPEMRYIITSSGAAVYDLKQDWEKILSNEIPSQIALEILEYAESVDCFTLVSVEGKTLYPADLAQYAPEYGLAAYVYEINTFGTGVSSVKEWYGECLQPVESMSLYFRDPNMRSHAVDTLKHLPLYFALTGEHAVEISMDYANKGYALEKLCERLQIDPFQVMAIGDSDNDIPMLQAVGFAVASGNAPDAVQSEADFVSADCDNDGVAVALERFVLE